MAKAVPKITLSASRDIPFNKLVLSQSNVRRLQAGVSIEELAEDIARRSLLQALNVRPVLDTDGAETGMFEIPAGGRRYRALERLVQQKRLSKTALIPCVVRDPGALTTVEEDCSQKMPIGLLCIHWTSFARSKRYMSRVRGRRKSPPASS